jgi:hypothetical protein
MFLPSKFEVLELNFKLADLPPIGDIKILSQYKTHETRYDHNIYP